MQAQVISAVKGFTAAQAAQKHARACAISAVVFTAAQAAQKYVTALMTGLGGFTAAQAAQKKSTQGEK